MKHRGSGLTIERVEDAAEGAEVTAKENLEALLARQEGDRVGALLALEAAEELCDQHDDWRWLRETYPERFPGAPCEAAEGASLCSAAIRALREELARGATPVQKEQVGALLALESQQWVDEAVERLMVNATALPGGEKGFCIDLRAELLAAARRTPAPAAGARAAKEPSRG